MAYKRKTLNENLYDYYHLDFASKRHCNGNLLTNKWMEKISQDEDKEIREVWKVLSTLNEGIIEDYDFLSFKPNCSEPSQRTKDGNLLFERMHQDCPCSGKKTTEFLRNPDEYLFGFLSKYNTDKICDNLSRYEKLVEKVQKQELLGELQQNCFCRSSRYGKLSNKQNRDSIVSILIFIIFLGIVLQILIK